DDHRLELGVIDVGWNDGAAARHFAAHEFRRDVGRHRGAKTLAVGERGLGALELTLAAEIFALGDVDHFLGDHAGARPFELRQWVSITRANRTLCRGEIAGEVLAADIAVVDRLDGTPVVILDAAALGAPSG